MTYVSRRILYNWPEILVNDVAIRGVLGQSFVDAANGRLSVKQIYAILLLTGLTVSTIFSSHLGSFSTHPPFKPGIQNYQQLADSNIKVAIYKEDYELLHYITNGSYSFLYKKFKIFSKFEEFHYLRETFNPHYAYPTSTFKMYYYSGLEYHYRRKLFHFSTRVCPHSMMQFFIPLGNNSYIRNRLYRLTLVIWESGLLDYWMKSKSFDDVVAAGKIPNLNISYENSNNKPLTVEDLYWIWLYYMVFNSVAITAFVFELLILMKIKKQTQKETQLKIRE